MTSATLRDGIRALLSSHPAIAVSTVGHTTHAERYVVDGKFPIAFEPDRVRHQNIWVRADSVRIGRLSDIKNIPHDHKTFSDGKPNHHIFVEPTFKDADVICFQVTDLWQAVRVILEVAGVYA